MTTTARSTTADAPPTRRWGAAAAGVAVVVLVVALYLGGGGTTPSVPGLGDPGELTRWGLPIAKAVLDGSAAVVIGMLGLATVLPVRNGALGGDALRALRAASGAALVLAGAAATVHLLTLSDLVGRPLGEALAGQAFTSYTGSVIQGQAYAAVFVLALTIVPAARLTVGHGGAIALLCLGIGTLVPLGLIGHSSSGDYHHSATISLLVHLIAMALWVGGLIAVAWYAGRRGRELPRAARAFSAVALGCFVLVGASGVVNAWVRFNSITEVFTTSYGLIMFGKIVALVALGVVGYMHRNRTLPVLEAGRRGAFRRLAAGEIVIMGAAVGLAVALSRSQPPVPDTPAVLTPARDLLGYPLPPEFSVSRIFTEIYPDALFSIGCLCAFLLYAGGVWRLHRRGDRWPVGRTIAWMSGIAIVAFAGLSGLQTYGMTMMSVHMVQHMTLMMVCPILLVLGGPITLALRAIGPARRGDIGPREIILAVLNSRVVRVLTNPLVALTLFATGSFMVYFSGLFEAAMREHTGHLLMSMHFLLVGYLFFEILIGIDPLPKRPPYPARVVVHLLAVAMHGFFGLALMESSQLIAGDYYRDLRDGIGWLPDTLADQTLAGQITWATGEVPGVIVIIILFVQWYRSDEREARRFDRREGDDEAERAAYNAYLARLEKEAQRRGE